MKIKTSELKGVALNWAVGVAEGLDVQVYGSKPAVVWIGTKRTYSPSVCWVTAGPIIERERIELTFDHDDKEWGAFVANNANDFCYFGPTPLVAAMRCFVASKLGGEVGVPKELTTAC